MSSIFQLFKTAQNSIQSQRQAMDVAIENVSNSMTPGYKSKSVVLAGKGREGSFQDLMGSMISDDGIDASVLLGDEMGAGSTVAQVYEDQTEGVKVNMPGHPMADENGMVEMSNVDTTKEMLTMMQAVRQYKANLTIVEMAKKAAQEALNMTKNA